VAGGRRPRPDRDEAVVDEAGEKGRYVRDEKEDHPAGVDVVPSVPVVDEERIDEPAGETAADPERAADE
jgi:hypothetical protein